MSSLELQEGGADAGKGPGCWKQFHNTFQLCSGLESESQMDVMCGVCGAGEEVGMLEDMDVGISDLQHVTFKITQARTDQPCHLQPVISGRR